MINSFNGFSALFTSDSVYVSVKAFPLRQHSTDILNLDDELLTEIERRKAACDLFTACGLSLDIATQFLFSQTHYAGKSQNVFLTAKYHDPHCPIKRHI